MIGHMVRILIGDMGAEMLSRSITLCPHRNTLVVPEGHGSTASLLHPGLRAARRRRSSGTGCPDARRSCRTNVRASLDSAEMLQKSGAHRLGYGDPS